MAPSPFMTGLLCRCPECGQGSLYGRYLKVRPSCSSCQASFADADTGDGPAIFVMMIVGFIVVFSALGVELTYRPDYWVHALLWLPLSVILTLTLLPPVKSLLVSMQFARDAKEMVFDTGEKKDVSGSEQ